MQSMQDLEGNVYFQMLTSIKETKKQIKELDMQLKYLENQQINPFPIKHQN